MALINCPECNKEISDKVESCIHCGYSIENNNKNNKTTLDSKRKDKKSKFKLYPIIILMLLIFLVGTSAFIIKQYNQIMKLEETINLADKNKLITTQKETSSDEKNTSNIEVDEVENEDEVQVTLLRKDTVPKDALNGIYSDYVTFEFEVKNNTDRGIRGIQGVLIVNDLFGVEILRINCDLVGTVTLPGNSYIDKDLSYECNQFNDADMKFYKTHYRDLNFEYKVTSIAYLPEQGN